MVSPERGAGPQPQVPPHPGMVPAPRPDPADTTCAQVPGVAHEAAARSRPQAGHLGNLSSLNNHGHFNGNLGHLNPASRLRPLGVAGSPWAALALSASIFAMVAWSAPDALPWVTVVLFGLLGVSLTHPLYLVLDALGVGTVVVLILTLAGQSAWSSQNLGLILLGTLALGVVLHRDRAELAGAIGGAAAADALLLDLRQRVWRRQFPPDLPPEWLLESDLRAARGDGFCGDFVVQATDPGRRLDLALVDVSGKGSAAGARAVLLSGALEALLNAVPPPQFLPAANAHVVRTGDDEGFATAVHASIDLVTGHFLIAGAGHPPVAHYRSGAGRWDLLDDDQGPALGLLPAPPYPARSGVLEHGDALLFYTDGLVESPLLDVTRGIDRLVGHADAVLARSRDGLARAITDAIRAQDGDDRALVVIRRF